MVQAILRYHVQELPRPVSKTAGVKAICMGTGLGTCSDCKAADAAPGGCCYDSVGVPAIEVVADATRATSWQSDPISDGTEGKGGQPVQEGGHE